MCVKICVLNAFDIKEGKDRIFKKYLNAGYQKPLFIQYSMPLILKWEKIAYLRCN